MEIKQAKVQPRPSERKLRESCLTVHREIYVKQRDLVSKMIFSSCEFFCLSSQMMGKLGDTMPPSNIPLSLLLISLIYSVCIKLKRSEAALTLTDQSPLTLLSSAAQSVQFQLVTEDFVKTVVQEMPPKSCDLDPIPTPVLQDCLDEIISIVTSIMNKS